MGEEKKLIYLDNAATTKTAPEVVEAIRRKSILQQVEVSLITGH